MSALLLFSVQPIITKMILPRWGGSPAVWNTSLLFFQAVLFVGYLYAHGLGRLAKTRQRLIHWSVLVVAFVVLPLAIRSDAADIAVRSPVIPLLAVLTLSIGLPFLAVSATAPLLINWFSHSGHAHAADPYFLYGASNVGSMVALLSYPTVIEPRLGLAAQGRCWTWGYALLVLVIGLCAFARSAAPPLTGRGSRPDSHRATVGEITWTERFRWLVLAAVPASLLLGVTLHISTDIAAAPFLWVVPLALYLLTFIFVFARRQIVRRSWVLQGQVILLVLLAIHFRSSELWLGFPLHLLAFFFTSMVCHGDLAQRRPATRHLTEFFVWMSAGGLLGGVLSVVVAPLVFRSVLEYPLLLAVACMLRPVSDRGTRRLALDVILAAALTVVYIVPTAAFGFTQPDSIRSGGLIYHGGVALVLFSFRNRPLRLALGFAAIVIGPTLVNDAQRLVARERSFFGVHSIELRNRGELHVLRHGTTIHGAQLLDLQYWRTPLMYYAQNGSLGQAFDALNQRNTLNDVGVLGLGAGAVACYLQSGQQMTFFEIDPTVERLARDRRYFRYLDECGAGVDVVIGDGRVSLSKTPDASFDLLIIDAFSSDAIPVHLMTREALALYVEKLKAGGVILFHISNDFMDLRSVLAALVADAGLQGRIQAHWPEQSPATWVAIAETPDALMTAEGTKLWDALETHPASTVWTDDYANVFQVLKW